VSNCSIKNELLIFFQNWILPLNSTNFIFWETILKFQNIMKNKWQKVNHHSGTQVLPAFLPKDPHPAPPGGCGRYPAVVLGT
jgi:hypothetical protein